MRVLSWFSCGAPSACAAKLAIEKYGKDIVQVVYCNTLVNEHPDNMRFFREVQDWLGVSIQVISSKKFSSIDDVVEKTRFMASPKGARCTTELKKIPRLEFELPDDIHIFGLTADESDRIDDFEMRNPEMNLEWILRDTGTERNTCLQIISEAGIELPAMYRLGFNNNNCIGCFKATGRTYWNKVRRHFPATFDLRARQSREIGCRLTRMDGERIFLDELPPDAQDELGFFEDLSCGPQCAIGGTA